MMVKLSIVKSSLYIYDAKQNVLGDFISTNLIQKGINRTTTQTSRAARVTF